MRTTYMAPLSLALLLSLERSAVAQSTSVSVCEEAEIIISHPAEYVQEKVKRKGLSCLLLPHCCSPAWMISPECYVWQLVKKRDPWEEIKNTYTCTDYQLTPTEAFERWLGGLFTPGMVVSFSILTGGLDQVFKAYLIAANQVALPLPNLVQTEMKQLVQAKSVPFTLNDIATARYLPADHTAAKPLFPGGGKGAIAYERLVIVRQDPFLMTTAAKRCARMSKWAHELTHVHQYVGMGQDAFILRYLEEGQHGYENISFEVEAEAVEDKVATECSTQSPTIWQPVIGGVAKAIMTDLQAAAAANEVTITPDGVLSRITAAARAQLEAKYGTAVVAELIPSDGFLPDLVVSRVRFDPLSKLRVRISNIGYADAGPFEVGIGIAGYKGPLSIGNQKVSTLKAGRFVDLTVTVPQIATAVLPFARPLLSVAITADVTHAVTEANENNNLLKKVLR